ncbi:Transcription initiation factor IIF subunit beta [Ceratobasidium theobromae]|uniref:Transcription initiation factor IIF subunit beta n=1 Tax=Ceratobasidium theobromae TaxID=1582974 RepID=A0A5N5QLQ1_9AGAM|nr:Transcription initiation factor IIF subunit beta [Ceratobasidium theobromae]
MDWDGLISRTRRLNFDSDSDSSDSEGLDEDLVIRGIGGTVWLVKVPKAVMEVWTQIDKDGEHLATLRVYHEADPPVVQLLLADDPALEQGLRGAVFTLVAVAAKSKNMVVVSERAGMQGDMHLEATVDRQWYVKPTLTPNWTRTIAKRNRQANVSNRQLIRIGDEGHIRKIASGAGHWNHFSNMVTAYGHSTSDRAVRIPKNELLDMLFKLFSVQSHWTMKVLKERTKQPLEYLRETLDEVAVLHKSGPNMNTWSLQASYAQRFGLPDESLTADASASDMDIDWEEDEDCEMEEVS